MTELSILDQIRKNEPFIKGVDHVAIIVKDMDTSIKFYNEVLGMLIIHDGRQDGGNKKSFLGIREKAFVALTENTEKNVDSNDKGSVSHIAFAVGDVEKSKQILEERGVEFIEEKTGDDGKTKAYHFLDPDGLELEIYGGTGEITPAY